MKIGTVMLSPVTVQSTLSDPPPPLPEPLHWLTVGVVEPGVPGGTEQTAVGSVPPPWPASTHWTTVVSTRVTPGATLLMIVTWQITVEPPALPEPSHCVIELIEVPL